jgi:hypothetical protein
LLPEIGDARECVPLFLGTAASPTFSSFGTAWAVLYRRARTVAVRENQSFAAVLVNVALSIARVLSDRCHRPVALKHREGNLFKSTNMRLGVAGPGPHLFFALTLLFAFCSPKGRRPSELMHKRFELRLRFPKLHLAFTTPISILFRMQAENRRKK